MLNVGYYNPIKKNPSFDDYDQDKRMKIESEIYLHTITPNQKGRPAVIGDIAGHAKVKGSGNVVLCILEEEDGKVFTTAQIKYLIKAKNFLNNKGVRCFDSMERLSKYLNGLIIN